MLPHKLITICCSLMYSTNAQLIYVWSDHNKEGTKVEISITTCSNFPDGMAGEVTSIDTRDNCARFYDGRNCTGRSIEIMARSPSHSNLHGWGFNDKAISVGPCRDSCSTSVTGEYEQGPIELTVFDRKNFKGAYADLEVHGCTLIPTKFIHRLLSVQTKGNCIQFYNNVNCKLKGDGADSIELRTGTPYHDDIKNWGFSEARAVSHCIFKCNETLFSNTTQNTPTPGQLKNGDVVLYDEKNFKGNWIKMNVQRCTNITGEWEGAAVSATTSSKGCFTLFDKRGCTGESLNIVSPRPNLHDRNFDALARSIKPCTEVTADNQVSGDNVDKPNMAKNTADFQTESSSAFSPIVITVIVVVPLLGVLLSVSLVLFIMKKCNPYGNIIEMLSEKEIQEFLRGLQMDIGNNGDPEGGDYSVELLAQNKPYNEAYEISRSNIKFDAKAPLGMGEFGVVYKGSVMQQTEDKNGVPTIENISVAVKTVRPNSNITCLRTLLKEVKVMLYAGMHNRVVQMIGCCTENLRKGEILVLMEYCSRGSLENFLLKNRLPFRNIVRKGRIAENFEQIAYPSYTQLDYQNWNNEITNFDIFKLLQWCIQVGEGMEFLASRKVIHSDLAARNVLLDENYEAKISDFGLSKQLYCYTQYVKKRQEPLPWRYLAIESIKNMEFSSQSDVWSYGVFCWEVFTLGEKPYPGVVWSDQFIRNLEDGLRLPKPKYAVTECYNLMLRCWEDDPNMRPTFNEIVTELNDITTSLLSTVRALSNPEYQTDLLQ
ncbi:unnamed protein product [Orchesella dallaii]|uniref:Protein kinase domain-containing protein n=1 Tax=Orchesella dallaii TaxID=48710 RepID=A0ABP1QEL0_9HEXA